MPWPLSAGHAGPRWPSIEACCRPSALPRGPSASFMFMAGGPSQRDFRHSRWPARNGEQSRLGPPGPRSPACRSTSRRSARPGPVRLHAHGRSGTFVSTASRTAAIVETGHRRSRLPKPSTLTAIHSSRAGANRRRPIWRVGASGLGRDTPPAFRRLIPGQVDQPLTRAGAAAPAVAAPGVQFRVTRPVLYLANPAGYAAEPAARSIGWKSAATAAERTGCDLVSDLH